MKVTDDGVPVEALISVVKDAIKRAGISRTSQDRDLQVASVQLILDVVAAKTAGGGLDFRVPFIGMKLRIGGKVTSKDTHTIDITLVPPEERATRQVRGGEVEEILVNAIATVRAVVAQAAAGDDPWVLSGALSTSVSPSRRPEPSPSASTANWRTRSPRPCALGWHRARHEHGSR